MSSASAPIRVIDADTHLMEPPDLWTARVPAKWLDQVPVAEIDDAGALRWRLGKTWLHTATSVGQGTTVRPTTWDEVDPACYDASERLKWMDRYGIYAQVLYPNLLGFQTYALMDLEPELQRLLFRTYNDYLVEVTNVAPNRYVNVTAVPFWDIDESIAEMQRCRELGHTAVLWASTMKSHGLPSATDPHWDRFYAVAQDLGMSINFHIATGRTADDWAELSSQTEPRKFVENAIPVGLGNAFTIAEVLMSEVCERFPRLNFVSVESGFGYVPYILELLDWQWVTSRASESCPDRLLPSEYFRRQVYTMFWFEQSTLGLLDQYPDNVMFETDFPHPTSLTPTPYTVGIPAPSDLIKSSVDKYGEELMRKVLEDNAARVYHVN
jgi:predicted TIM-barrel fold metal-dependent hydrolase